MKINGSEAVRMFHGLLDNGLIPELMWTANRQACITAMQKAFEPFIAADLSSYGQVRRALNNMEDQERYRLLSEYCCHCGKHDPKMECSCDGQ